MDFSVWLNPSIGLRLKRLADEADRFKSLRLPAELQQVVMASSSATEVSARWLGSEETMV